MLCCTCCALRYAIVQYSYALLRYSTPTPCQSCASHTEAVPSWNHTTLSYTKQHYNTPLLCYDKLSLCYAMSWYGVPQLYNSVQHPCYAKLPLCYAIAWYGVLQLYNATQHLGYAMLCYATLHQTTLNPSLAAWQPLNTVLHYTAKATVLSHPTGEP